MNAEAGTIGGRQLARDQVEQAKAGRQLARDQVEQAKAELARAHSTRDRQRNVLAAAVEAERTSSIEDAPTRSQARRDADDRLAAAERHVIAATEALSAKRAALINAEAPVKKAAAELIRLEIEALYDEFIAIEMRRQGVRDKLLGAYQAFPEALPDIAWHKVDRGWSVPCETLNIGLPLVASNNGGAEELFFPNWQAHRAPINAATEEWTKLLQQLERGDFSKAAAFKASP